MIKLVNPSQYDCSDARMSVVPTTSKGIDRDWLTKHASPRLQRFREFTPDSSEHSLLHVIAMGASDHFGANRNGDAFYRGEKTLDLPMGDWKYAELADGSVEPKNDKTFTNQLHKGLIHTHPTFTRGHVFRDHKNDAKKDKIHGTVKASVYDDDMHRVELLMQVKHSDKDWTRDVQAVEQGKEIPLSMACLIPYDVCELCGHKAATRAKYCKHASDHLTQALRGGHVAAVANEDANYFDISRVKRGADRIAFTMRKVAGLLTDDELDEYPGLHAPLDILTASQPAKIAQKMAILDKLSRMEKEIPAVGRSPAGLLRHARRAMEPSAEFHHLEGDRDKIPEVAQALKAAYVVLPVRQFVRWICGSQGDKHASLTERALDGCFSRLMAGDALDVCASDTYASDYALRMELSLQKAAGAVGGKVTLQALQSQAARASLHANPNAKQASAEEPTEIHQVLARQYAEYVVTVLSELQKSADFDLDIACAAVIPC